MTIELTDRDYQDYWDMKGLVDSYLYPVRCKGGRIVRRDYQCSHCHSENPTKLCKEPMTECLTREDDEVTIEIVS